MNVFGIRVRIHPLFLLVVALAVYGHFLQEIIVLFGVVVIHELGHVIAASRYGYRTEYIELLPFGGVARLSIGALGWNARHETVIAIWGPMMNLLLTLLALIIHLGGGLSEAATNSFVSMNLTLMFFNLLPGLPLDGGRISRAGLSLTRGYEQATRVVTMMSFYIATVMMVLGALSLWLGYSDIGLLALGAFLLFSAYTLSRQTKYDTLRFLDAKRREEDAGTQPLRSLAVSPGTSIGEVASRFVPGAYHLIYIRTKGFDAGADGVLGHGVIEEGDILAAIFEDGMWTEPVARLLF